MNPATALLETLVHMEIYSEDQPDHFQVLKIEGTGSLSLEKIGADSLPPNWAEDLSITQAIGDRWLAENRSLLLQAPGVLVPETWNILVNPRHSEISLLKITKVYNHPFGARLF
jgi:RES domain-containing protein